jgi:hypothetical protein
MGRPVKHISLSCGLESSGIVKGEVDQQKNGIIRSSFEDGNPG